MDSRGKVRLDPGSIDATDASAGMELVVAHTEWSITAALLEHAAGLLDGLDARIVLLAVHTAPSPESFSTAASIHAELVEELIDLASRSPLPITPRVVLAHGQQEGYEFALKPGSTVLMGKRKCPGRGPEDWLAEAIARDGHKVALLQV